MQIHYFRSTFFKTVIKNLIGIICGAMLSILFNAVSSDINDERNLTQIVLSHLDFIGLASLRCVNKNLLAYVNDLLDYENYMAGRDGLPSYENYFTGKDQKINYFQWMWIFGAIAKVKYLYDTKISYKYLNDTKISTRSLYILYAFDMCCEYAFLNKAKWIIDLPEMKNSPPFMPHTIRLCCLSGSFEVVEWLLSLRKYSGFYYNDDLAFEYCCQRGHLRIAKLLMEFGSVRGLTPLNESLISSCKNGFVDVAVYLIDLGANIRYKDDLAFNLGCFYGHEDVARMLCERVSVYHIKNIEKKINYTIDK